MNKKDTKLEVIPAAKLAINANLKGGGDAAAAKQLTKLFTEAQTGMRRIVALGLFAWELKETRLKHGQFGAWLMANCPSLATADAVTGQPRPSRALSGYMDLTKGVLENVGFDTVEKYLDTAGKCANDAHLGAGKFLLIADKKVPADLKPLREKIFDLVDGKTQRALFTQFKQAEDDDEGNAKPKRGRLKGQGGASKEQRAAAAEREAEEQITELNLRCSEVAEWLQSVSDDAGLGRPGVKDSPSFTQLMDAMKYCIGHFRHTGKEWQGGES